MKLEQTNDYLLLIDEKTEIKEYFDGYVYQPHWKKPVKLENDSISLGYAEEDRRECGGGKIIAYYPITKEAKEFDLPELPNPFNLDFNELEWNDIASEDWKSRGGEGKGNWMYRQGYVHGAYKAIAQSKQFSLEDMLDAFEYGLSKPEFQLTRRLKEDFNNFVKSLSTQQLPKEFEISYVDNGEGDMIPHVTTNSLGKEILVGTYKY